MAINSVNNNPNVVPTQLPPDAEKIVEKVVEEILPLFGGDNLEVTEPRPVHGKGREKREVREIPELDDVDVAMLEGIAADLEAVIAFLQAEQDEKTIEATKARINALKGQLEANHKATMDKVSEAIDKMKQQEKAALANKILGWLGVVVAVVVAVALAVTGAGAVVAGFAIAGAVLSATMMGLTEGGVMDKLAKAIADDIQKHHPDWSKETCMMFAQLSVAAIQVGVSLTCIIGGGVAAARAAGSAATKALIDVSTNVLKGIRIGSMVANGVMATGSIAASGAATGINYAAGMKQAEVTEMQQFLVELQAFLDQESEDLKELLDQLANALGAILDLLQSKQDTLNEIDGNIGA